MRQVEQTFWNSIRNNKPDGVWLQRVENGIVYGMPDVLTCFKESCAQIWLELKAGDVPARDTTPPIKRGDIRIHQINWHMKADLYSVPSAIALRLGKTNFILPGKLAGEAHAIPMREMAQFICYDWNEFWMKAEAMAKGWK